MWRVSHTVPCGDDRLLRQARFATLFLFTAAPRSVFARSGHLFPTREKAGGLYAADAARHKIDLSDDTDTVCQGGLERR
jgi:hypothetical protein